MSFDKNQTTGRPRLAALQQGAGALGLAVLSAGALAGNPGACAAIADNTERLACYDESVGRPHQEAPPPAAAVPLAREPSALSKRWELDAEDKRGTFLITPYKPTYILLGRWTNSANRMPTSPNPANTLRDPVDVDPAEAKYQISFKTKLWEGLVGRHGDLWLGYTQQSNWQVYNKSFSSPFRETDYEPELMAVFRTNLDAGAGFKVKMMSLGLNHQSNGRSQPYSRSWNRIVGQIGIERGDFALVFRPWRMNYVPNAAGIAGIAAVVLIGNVLAFSCYMSGVMYIGPQKSSLFSFAEPVTAAIISTLVLGSPFTLWDALGFGCIFLMLVLLSLPAKQKN